MSERKIYRVGVDKLPTIVQMFRWDPDKVLVIEAFDVVSDMFRQRFSYLGPTGIYHHTDNPVIEGFDHFDKMVQQLKDHFDENYAEYNSLTDNEIETIKDLANGKEVTLIFEG